MIPILMASLEASINLPCDLHAGEAENLLANIEASGKGGKKDTPQQGGAARKHNAKGKRYGSGPTTTDEQLMSRLGEILGGNMKEDFIVVRGVGEGTG